MKYSTPWIHSHAKFSLEWEGVGTGTPKHLEHIAVFRPAWVTVYIVHIKQKFGTDALTRHANVVMAVVSTVQVIGDA